MDGLYDGLEAAGYDSASGGKYFKVSSDEAGTANVKYFNNIHAALNYIYTTDVAAYKVTSGSDTVYTGTITLLTEITDGQPFMLGGQENYSGGSLSIIEAKKGNITIDLGGFNYHFSKALTSSNSDASKSKAITIRNNAETTIKIKNGSITVAAQSSGDGALFERVIKNDNAGTLTLESVNIDATNLKGQFGGEDGAAICTTGGTLKLTGSTTIKVNEPSGEDIFYAVGLKCQSGRSNVKIEVDTTGTIPNVGFYGWVDPDDLTKSTSTNPTLGYYGATSNGIESPHYPFDFGSTNYGITIKKGTIGELTVDGVALDKTGWTSYSSKTKLNVTENDTIKTQIADNITVTAGKDNISFDDNAHSLASFKLFDQDATVTANNTYLLYQKNGDKYPYTLAIEGWNRQTAGDDTELNYVAQSLNAEGTADSQGRGDWLINVKNVSDKADLALDSEHKLFGIPTSATP